MQQKYTFLLPHGYQDAQGNVHREGIMRKGSAIDEVKAMMDPRVQKQEGFEGLFSPSSFRSASLYHAEQEYKQLYTLQPSAKKSKRTAKTVFLVFL